MKEKLIIIIILCIVLIGIIFGINKNNKSKEADETNNTFNYTYDEINEQYIVYDENNSVDTVLRSEQEVQLKKDFPDYDPQIYTMGD